MANTFELIASSTVGAGGATTIDFTSIPQTYTDLCLKLSARVNQSSSYGIDVYLLPNGSSSSLTAKRLYGDGSAAGSDSLTQIRGIATSTAQTANTFANTEFYIPNYTGSTYKSVSVDGVAENNATNAFELLVAGLWSNTAAITSLTLSVPSTFAFQQYSTAYLYGVKNA